MCDDFISDSRELELAFIWPEGEASGTSSPNEDLLNVHHTPTRAELAPQSITIKAKRSWRAVRSIHGDCSFRTAILAKTIPLAELMLRGHPEQHWTATPTHCQLLQILAKMSCMAR
jgi:hypothetical protein